MTRVKRCLLCKNKLGRTAQEYPERGIKYCKSCYFKSPEFLSKVSKGWFKKGENPWNKGLSIRLNPEGEFKKDSTPWNKGISHSAGKKHWNWQGGLTKEQERVRKSFEYKNWRSAVFERDGYACTWCEDKQEKGKRVMLNADHIRPFSLFPELRFDLSNGRTLCEKCHKRTDSYLNRYLTREDYETGKMTVSEVKNKLDK